VFDLVRSASGSGLLRLAVRGESGRGTSAASESASNRRVSGSCSDGCRWAGSSGVSVSAAAKREVGIGGVGVKNVLSADSGAAGAPSSVHTARELRKLEETLAQAQAQATIL
jgi:hypothetical protein